MRQVSTLLQKVPWVARIAQSIWRLGRPKFSAGVVGVIFDEAGHVLLVEHVFHPYAPWGLPGGWIDRQENPWETVARELLEELELKVEVGSVLRVQIDGNHLDVAYLCYARSSIGKLSNELLDYGWYDPAQLPKLHRFHYQAIQSALAISQR